MELLFALLKKWKWGVGQVLFILGMVGPNGGKVMEMLLYVCKSLAVEILLLDCWLCCLYVNEMRENYTNPISFFSQLSSLGLFSSFFYLCGGAFELCRQEQAASALAFNANENILGRICPLYCFLSLSLSKWDILFGTSQLKILFYVFFFPLWALISYHIWYF